MFVFWYCHKRGREMRLAKEAAAGGKDGESRVEEVEGDDDDLEVEVTDEEEGEDEAEEGGEGRGGGAGRQC